MISYDLCKSNGYGCKYREITKICYKYWYRIQKSIFLCDIGNIQLNNTKLLINNLISVKSNAKIIHIKRYRGIKVYEIYRYAYKNEIWQSYKT